MDYEQLKGNLEDVLNDLRHLALSHESIQFDESLPCTAGGYGDVFKATLRASDNGPDRLVAVKELRRAGDPVSRTRLAIHLARELRVWARLKHRNILDLIGYHLNAQMTTALIVSPFMANGNIIEYLGKAGGWASDHERLELLIDVLNGLDYLHTSTPPICHADIKPENVLITDQIVAVLCDFGLARLDDGTSSGLTTTKTIKGSVRYMSPELLDEGAYHTLKSDMWAYGCLALKVMTGVMPYSAARSDPQVMMALIQRKSPAALTGLGLPDRGLKPLLKGCWDLSPMARPSASASLRSLIGNDPPPQKRLLSDTSDSVFEGSSLVTSPDSFWKYEVQDNTDLATIDDTREGTTEDEPAVNRGFDKSYRVQLPDPWRVFGGGGGGGRRMHFIAKSRRQIIVRNLPWSTANEDLVELFETIGNVELAEIWFDETRCKVAGVVQFTQTEEAETAIAKFGGYMYGGLPLYVSYNDRWHTFTPTAAKGGTVAPMM